MKDIKIIHIITRLDKGGSSRILLDICRAMQGEQFSIKIISGKTIDAQEDLVKFSKDNHIEVVFVNSLRRDVNIFLDILALFKLFRILKKERPDIVHLHTSKAGFLARLAAFCAHVPVVLYMPHGNIFYGYYPPFLTRLFVLLERFAAPLASRIITLTDIGRQEFLIRGIGTKTQFVTIPNGIDIDKYSQLDNRTAEKLRQDLKIGNSCVVISVIGRLESVKGIDVFIDALIHLTGRTTDFKALIVGEGSQKEKLINAVKEKGIEGKVSFLNYKYDVREIISLSDLVVNPSLNEGQGLAILEAQALEKCVIATRVGGVPEVIIDGKTGILVEPGDPRKLAEAIIKILNDKETAQGLGKEASKRVAEHFSKNEMIARFKNLYLNLFLDSKQKRQYNKL